MILTGMGDDGAGGCSRCARPAAGRSPRNEATCVVFGMPREAIRRGAARQVLPLDRIADAALAGGHEMGAIQVCSPGCARGCVYPRGSSPVNVALPLPNLSASIPKR